MTKTILITGATDGIGQLTAKTLAAEGHTILIHGRTTEKLEKAAKEIGGTTESYAADLTHMDQIHAMAADIRKAHDSLDVIINNAGVLKLRDTMTDDGYDVRFVVNTVAPYVLTQALLPILAEDGRIVNLSSAAQAPVDIEALHGRRQLDHNPAYAQSKLALTIWTRELAKTLPAGQVAVAVNPGSLLASKMVKEGYGMEGNDLQIGADILREAALGASFTDANGKYFDNDNRVFANPHAAALDADHSAQVMQGIKDVIAKIG
ncbi:SDR family NAD(P)-dependent oxidoreductase [Phaeobacter inhibens]|uniref:SDR family NAD(P)-dependent oxidoreductase n=1 Tax=Phaeobacter inhibens TaxID=221822 RepID=UPI0004249FDC|nr:SDR family NAD(P)-dependent oxidoreductase [Phaeobacter inhibens]